MGSKSEETPIVRRSAAEARASAHYKGCRTVRGPRLDATRQAEWVRARYVRADGSELTPEDLAGVVEDFAHWRRYSPGLDHAYRLKPRKQAFAASADRLREFTSRSDAFWRRGWEYRRESPADTRPIRIRTRTED